MSLPSAASSLLQVITLSTELVLLAATFVLVFLSRKEAKARDVHIRKIVEASKIVSRQEYFNNVVEGMQAATSYIEAAITGTSPKSSETTAQIQNIVSQIRTAYNRNISIRYLVPKSEDRVSLGYRYKEVGADVRFHPDLLLEDMRYMIIDGRLTILGLPLISGENEPVREGYRLPSEGTAIVFHEQFQRKWSEALRYEDYVKEVVRHMMTSNPRFSIVDVAARLGIPSSSLGYFT